MNLLELIDLLRSTNLKSILNVGILDSRWQEGDFRIKYKKNFWNDDFRHRWRRPMVSKNILHGPNVTSMTVPWLT